MSAELKSCPFCGGEPSLLADVTHSTAWEIECPGVSCSVRPSVWEEDKQSAIAAWNTRAEERPSATDYRNRGERDAAYWRELCGRLISRDVVVQYNACTEAEAELARINTEALR